MVAIVYSVDNCGPSSCIRYACIRLKTEGRDVVCVVLCNFGACKCHRHDDVILCSSGMGF